MSLLNLVVGQEDWLGGLAGRTGGKEPWRRKSGISAWCGRIFVLPWRKSRVGRDIDIVLLAIVPT